MLISSSLGNTCEVPPVMDEPARLVGENKSTCLPSAGREKTILAYTKPAPRGGRLGPLIFRTLGEVEPVEMLLKGML